MLPAPLAPSFPPSVLVDTNGQANDAVALTQLHLTSFATGLEFGLIVLLCVVLARLDSALQQRVRRRFFARFLDSSGRSSEDPQFLRSSEDPQFLKRQIEGIVAAHSTGRSPRLARKGWGSASPFGHWRLG